MPSLQTARSFLFAPGNDERKLVGALESGADAVIADLEDAVTPAEKAGARRLAVQLLRGADTPSLRLVRVNAVGTAWHAGDLAAVAESGIDGIVLPKAQAATADGVAVETGGLPVVAIVETALAVRDGFALASSPAISALMLGAVDLGLALGLESRPDGQELLFARSSLVVDSAAAAIRGPIDQVWVRFRDLEGLERDCVLARSLGFKGKSCIHPDQVPVVNQAFAPSASELQRAREVVAAYEHAAGEGRGAVALGDEMVDLPVVERARQLIADDKRSVLNAD